MSEKNTVKLSNNRIMYMEYLRVAAVLFVVFAHIARQGFDGGGLSREYWMIYNVWNSICRWSVDALIMISGAVFLGREIETKKIYQKYLLRIAIAFVFWKLIYAVYECSQTGNFYEGFVQEFIDGPFHFWYLPVIMGLYICIPIYKQIVKSERVMKYFLLLSFVLQFALPQIRNISADIVPEGLFAQLETGMFDDINAIMAYLVFGYGFYFVLGYYLHVAVISRRQQLWIYVFGVLGLLATIGLVAVTDNQSYYDHFTVNVLVQAIACFVFFKQHVNGWESLPWLNNWMIKFSKWSFGAYIVHLFVISIECTKFNIFVGRAHPIISVPVISVFTFVVSMGLSAILNQIPVVKKYLV